MKRLWLTIAALLLAAGPASAQFNTRGTESYRNALTPNNEFGIPRFTTTALPSCPLNLGGLAWDTTASVFKVCDASTWAEVGGGIAVGDDNDWIGANTWLDNKWTLKDGAALTATMTFLLDDITAGQQSVITVPDADFTLPIISQTLTFSGPSAARTITLPDANFTVARVELSNLASVALNTALLPDAAAADDFGSATLPFKDLWLAGSSGTPATNNFKITGASTSGTRTVTLPDASLTVAGQDIDNAFSVVQTFSAGGTVTGGAVFRVADNIPLQFGSIFAADDKVAMRTTMTPDSVVWGLGNTSQALHVMNEGDIGYDFNNGPCGVVVCTDPTFVIHSANQATDEWVSVAHDQTNAHVSTGKGGVLGLAYAVEANTGAKTPTLGTEADENRELYTNTGDGDGSSVTMPNDPTAGAVFRVAVTVNGQTITIAPGAGEDLYYEGDECTADTLTSATIGTMVEIVAVTGGAGAVWIANGAGWTCNDV